jgi:pantoate--beta-alanine ligase
VDLAAAPIEREPLARIEYVFVVDPESLSAVITVDERALVALAVWVGSTRLIDNRLLAVPAIKTERRSA